MKTFAKRLTPPYSGQIQIVETDTYRALTLDGQIWEVQYLNRIHIRICTMSAKELQARSSKLAQTVDDVADPALGELFDFLATVQLPFTAIDHFEYWLLDREEKAPLALIYSCATEQEMEKFPSRADWNSLPDAAMHVQKTDSEIASGAPPVNYQLESLVSERAGTSRRAKWVDRREHTPELFPPYLVREDWPEPKHASICKRYIDRQAPRLLMLQTLMQGERARLEQSCEPYATEVARFFSVYPEVMDTELINALRVEARLLAV